MKTFQMPILSMSLLGLCLLSGLDTPPAHADFTFGEPVKQDTVIRNLQQPDYADWTNCCSYDGLEMYILSLRPGGQGYVDLWVLKRDSVDEDWGAPENLGPAINSPKEDDMASISADGLTLYFQSDRAGGYGSFDIYMATRATKNAPWGQAVNMGTTINSSSSDICPWVSPDGLELYFVSYRPGGYGAADIWVARRATTNTPWDSPVNLGPVVNSPYPEAYISLSPDGLLLFFCETNTGSFRPGGYGAPDSWMTRRATPSDPWQTPVNLGPKVNGSSNDGLARTSPDGRTLYFLSGPGDASTLIGYQAPIIPIVDFNGDGIVDIADVFIMLEHWHTDNSLCDIGPMPWGDGIVDAQDLIVLAEHMANTPADVNDVNSL